MAASLKNIIPFGPESTWSDDLRGEPAFNGIIAQDMAIQAKAFHCSRAAQRDEEDGLPYSAAMKWRNAAELFAPNTQAVEYCWREWERIMQLPRRLAGPASGSPHRLKCHLIHTGVAMWMRCCSARGRVMRSHWLRMRLEMVNAMAIVIKYYVPEKFRKQAGKWAPAKQRGKVIPFPVAVKKSA